MRKLHELPTVGKSGSESIDSRDQSRCRDRVSGNSERPASIASSTGQVGRRYRLSETNPRIHPIRGLRGRCWIRTNVGEPTVLQTAPFGHSGNLPCWREPAIEDTSRHADVMTNPQRHSHKAPAYVGILFPAKRRAGQRRWGVHVEEGVDGS